MSNSTRKTISGLIIKAKRSLLKLPEEMLDDHDLSAEFYLTPEEVTDIEEARQTILDFSKDQRFIIELALVYRNDHNIKEDVFHLQLIRLL